ncbi:cation-transporting P-type ATPase [Micropruina sp.]|uniref:cation-translocating P-type ATPase n=1 Tax=Micropruina sp. TaxID=2737536 RepID=UPI00261F56C8|nr:cation-transporting P-type ATPase [Micropruina sp.]
MTSQAAEPAAARRPWYAMAPREVTAELDVDPDRGLDAAAVRDRRAEHGENRIASEPPPTRWTIALRELGDPMNLMLLVVSIASLVIGQLPVGIMVAALVVLNVVLGTQQELKALSAVDALAKMQTPQARVIRDGSLAEIPAPELVPGDILQLEAGDLVPADGRILRSASCEAQEAALTGESAPIPKGGAAIDAADVALGDRTSMLFQNTSITRGTATMVVTETGMGTEMGQIATMLSAVPPSKSPLQRELASLTKVLGVIAWTAVVIIVIIGFSRGQKIEAVLLLGISMAVSAIPTGLPTFVQAMLAFGAKKLAEAKAVVKNLGDVETLGATSAINSDKTGTLTLNEMMVRKLYYRGEWFNVSGDGYEKTGQITGAAGMPVPDFTRLAYGLCLDSDATVSDRGEVVGDPTEAALVVLAAKLGVDAEETRRSYPRVAEVPFDSDYKFMVTYHHVPLRGAVQFVGAIKGGPDVVLDRCSHVIQADGGEVPIDLVRDEILAANREMSEKGLRVLAFGIRELDGQEEAVQADPMGHVEQFRFVGMVGIIDPLRPSSLEAVRIAHAAGIDVRMITGDHAITAGAIGAELGLGPGAISGAEIQEMTDDEVKAALPRLHVFGRVTPQDKLRLAKLMQETGEVVAMTGDAVNDAAALKQADIGVAMGSGSEVTKQAAKMILTDDNFGTLVNAIRLGRGIYDKVTSYVRYQMTQLFSLVLLFLVASIMNINGGMPLTPLMVLYLNFFVCAVPIVMIMLDPTPDDIMNRPPRNTAEGIANKRSIGEWLLFGFVLFAITLVALLIAPGTMSPEEPNVPVTMAFAVMGLGTVFSALVMRRSPGSGLSAPIMGAVKILLIPTAMTVLAVQWGWLSGVLGTVPLNSDEWMTVLGLSLILPVVVELYKLLRRDAAKAPEPDGGLGNVLPERALATTGPGRESGGRK